VDGGPYSGAITTIFAPRSMHSMNQWESVSLFSTRFLPSMMISFEKRRSLKSQSEVWSPCTQGWPGAWSPCQV
jgi:hypothetical protein